MSPDDARPLPARAGGAQTPERYSEIMAEFDAAADLDPAAQRAFLDGLKVRDAGLALEVESLLVHDARSSAGLAPPGALDLQELTATATLQPGEGLSEPDSQRSTEPPGGRGSAPDAGTVLAGRYRIGDVIGSGGGGTVCRARDMEKDVDVAVKFLRSERVQSERGLRRFRREFRAVARLDHPGCMQAFAEGVEGDRRYIVMEYVSGGDLDRLVGAPTDLVLAVLVQVAVALDYVHSRQIVHRDLKPANILLAPGDPPAPRIADFGIALLDDDPSWQTDAGALVGTVDYLSPEQVEGRPADPRSDLYALGCMIFRLWARRPPFVGPSYLRLMARCRQTAPLLRQLATEAPPGLEDLVARLLAIDPAARPQSALEVADVLAGLLVATGSPLASRLFVSTSLSANGAFLYAPGLVGRDDEQARLVSRARAVAAGAPGEPPFFAICAEGGMGKTALCQAVQAALTAEGFRTVSAAVPSSAAGPLAPFPELRATLDHLTAAMRTGATAAPAPELRRISDDGGLGLRHEAAALVERMRSAQIPAPILVLIEDLHYADLGSHEILVEIARLLTETPGRRPVLIATLRPEGRRALLDAVASIERASGRGVRGESVGWVDLEPLGAAGVAGVAAAMLGVRASKLPPALVELLRVESDGIPLLVHSALRALVTGGALRRTGGRWELDDALAAARSTGRVLVDRLSALSPPTRRLLEVAATVGRRFDAELIQAATSESDDAVQDALDEALRAGVIRGARSGPVERQHDAFEFEHARLAEVLHDGMPAEARKDCHAALSRALAARGAPAAVLARHHALGGEPLAAFHSLRDAADEALQHYDHAGAARLYREALVQAEGLPGGTTLDAARESCREGLADALVVTGPMSQAVTLLTGLLGSDQTPVRAGETMAKSSRVRRLRKLGYARMRSGDAAGAISALQQALDTVADAVPRGRPAMLLRGVRDVLAVMLGRLFSVAPLRGDAALIVQEAAVVHRELGQLYRWINLERSQAHHIASARAAERVGSPDLQVDAFASLAMALAFLYDGAASLALERLASRLARSAGDRVGFARLLLLRSGLDIVVRDDIDGGMVRFDEGVRLAQASGDRVMHAWALSWRGWGGIIAGRLGGAHADFDRAHAVGTDLAIGWLVADSACGRSLVDCVQGRFDVALGAARELLASDVRFALPAIEGLSTEVLGAAAFMRGQYREAVAEYSRARTIYERHHLERGWGYLLELEETDSLLCLADQEGPAAVPDLLRRIGANARRHRRRLGRLPMYRGCTQVLRGVHYARSGRHDVARRIFARAVAERPAGHETYMDGWVMWRTAFERSRMGDSPSELRPLLDEVEKMYEHSAMDGIKIWLASARKIYGL